MLKNRQLANNIKNFFSRLLIQELKEIELCVLLTAMNFPDMVLKLV